MRDELKKLGITHILAVAAQAQIPHPQVKPFHFLFPHHSSNKQCSLGHKQDFICKQLPVLDTKVEDLLSLFESSIEFINEGRSQGGVLVHWYKVPPNIRRNWPILSTSVGLTLSLIHY